MSVDIRERQGIAGSQEESGRQLRHTNAMSVFWDEPQRVSGCLLER